MRFVIMGAGRVGLRTARTLAEQGYEVVIVERDADKARLVMERDQTVDAYYAQLFPELVSDMITDPSKVFQATRLQSIGKYLERIADHATNLAEMVVFMVKGRDVRHAGKM